MLTLFLLAGPMSTPQVDGEDGDEVRPCHLDRPLASSVQGLRVSGLAGVVLRKVRERMSTDWYFTDR